MIMHLLLTMSIIATLGAGGAMPSYPLIELDSQQTDAPPGYVAYKLRAWGVVYKGTAANVEMEIPPLDDRKRPILLNFEGESHSAPGEVSRIFLPSSVHLSKEILETDAGPPPRSTSGPARSAHDARVFRKDVQAGKRGVAVYRGLLQGVVVRGLFRAEVVDAEHPPAGAVAMFTLTPQKRYWIGPDFLIRPTTTGEESVIEVPDGVTFPDALLKP